MIEIFIDPVPKPRQTRSDVWKKRPCVVRYRGYADKLRYVCKKEKFQLKDVLDIEFYIPMPKSWSQKKKDSHEFKYHRQKPDIDNLCKSVMDALLKEDSTVYKIKATKMWAKNGMVVIH